VALKCFELRNWVSCRVNAGVNKPASIYSYSASC